MQSITNSNLDFNAITNVQNWGYNCPQKKKFHTPIKGAELCCGLMLKLQGN